VEENGGNRAADKNGLGASYKKLVSVNFPDTEKIVLVHDNLNTHTIGSLHKTFTPEEARRLRDKLEIHYTPKHGSWLNMAEVEINMLVSHGLSKRVSTIQQMRREVVVWNKARNKTASKIIVSNHMLFVSGVVGVNKGTVQNCVALNPNISRTCIGSIWIGRNVGQVSTVDTILANNYGRSDMKANGENTTWTNISQIDHDTATQNPMVN